MERLLLIDGNSLINRAYWAFGTGGGLSFNGTPTNATYGFLNMLLRAVSDLNPKYVAVAFDLPKKTFRHQMFAEYKAGRRKSPDELVAQIIDLKLVLKTMQISILEKEGFEADDIIGTVARRVKENGGCQTVILTADRDGLQLVDECTELYLTKTGVTALDIWTPARVTTEYGLTPDQLIDLKALMGDKSDNIPGCPGVGEKTALELMREYGGLETIYQKLDSVKVALREKLEANRETVYLSRDLARINTDVPIEINQSAFEFRFPFDCSVRNCFADRGFKTLCNRTALWAAPATEQPAPKKTISKIEIQTQSELEKLCSTKPKCVSITWDDIAYYMAFESGEYKIPILKDLLSGGFDETTIISAIKPLLESDADKTVSDSKLLGERLQKYGIAANNIRIDAKICDYLLGTKTAFYCSAGELLDVGFIEKLTRNGMLALYQEIELPLVNVLLKMQQKGARIDLKALQRISDKYTAQLAELSGRICALAGEQFNINSPQQLGEVLYKKLGLETTVKTKTGLSTNEAVLVKLEKSHPIISEILRYRKIHKLFSTYVQGFKNLADAGGFVHSTFHNTATVTGRLSSSDPNLQNIPARSEESREIRTVFTSRFDGGKIITADYSQIELRLLAHFSDDSVMKSAFQNNHDIHTETATKVFDCAVAEITPDMRRQAKAVNFGIVYGISAFGLSESIGCSIGDAARFIERYFAQFPQIKKFLDRCRDNAISNGYATTLLGRRRMIPELTSGNQNTVQFGIRAAMNMPMQGSASDIIKKAMVELDHIMAEKKLQAVMVAQVHDELIFDVPANEVKILQSITKEIMENVVKLSVPLIVDIEIKDTF